jgi:hypothetical protein
MSVAQQFTIVRPVANTLPDAGSHTTLTPGQLSVTEVVNCTTASQRAGVALTVMSPGQTRTGRSVSVTLTWNVQVALLPFASVAVQFTFVWPTGKRAPDGGTQLNVTPRQLSLVFKAKFTTASQFPGSHDTPMSPGQTMRGFSPSTTSTLKEQRLLFWFTSVATHSTTVIPTPNNDPPGGMHVTFSIPQLSVTATS